MPAFHEKKLHADLSSPASNSGVSPKKGAGAGSPHPQCLLLISNGSVQLQPQKKKLKDVAGAPLPSHGGPQDTRGRKAGSFTVYLQGLPFITSYFPVLRSL